MPDVRGVTGHAAQKEVSERMRTAAHEWESFRRKIPADASPAQYRDMRRAFYLGIASGLNLVIIEAESSPTHRSVPHTTLDGLVREVAAFVEHVNAGGG